MSLDKLANINPELLALIITGLGTGLGWMWKKARGEKTRDLSELLDDAITAEVEDALEDGETVAAIENRLTKAGLKLAASLGLKLPPQTVRIAVQWGVVEFRKALQARARVKAAAEKLASQEALLVDAATKTVAAFTAKGTIPRLEMDVEIDK
jgi:hypothetical protein